MNTYQQIVLLLAALSLPVHGADSFDGKTLTVPKVFVGGTLYSDVQLTVGKVLSVEGGDARNIYDRYNTANNQLIIPSVAVGGNSYTNVTIEVGSVVSVGGISTTLSANFKNTTSLLSVDSALGVAHSTGLIPFDTNGDGVTDLIFTPSTLNIGPDRKAFLVSNAGNNFNLQPDGVWSKVITTGFVKDWTIKDLNSDGVSDLIWIDHGLELPANQGGFQNGLNVALLSQTKGQYSYRTLSDLKAFNHGLTVPNSSAINNSSSLIVADFQARLKQYTIDSKGNFLQSDLSLGNEFGYSNPGAVATVRMKSNSTSVVAASYTRPNPQWDPNGSIIVYSYDGVRLQMV